jgi:segregation and condensation protein B
MRRDLEALLFASDQPLSLDRLAGFFPDVDRKSVREAIDELREEYDRDQHAFTIVEFGGGYSITTRPEHASLVKKLFKGRRKQRLSRPALEVLAIIAYKQPVTRLEIEEIRGVAASGVIGTLLERDLVQIVGRAETLGHPLLYGTTKGFLDHIGLRNVKELPQLSELEDLLAEKEELKQLATARGEELGDEDFELATAEDEDDGEGESGEGPEPAEEAAESETAEAAATDEPTDEPTASNDVPPSAAEPEPATDDDEEEARRAQESS